VEPTQTIDGDEKYPRGSQRHTMLDGRRQVSLVGWLIGEANSQNGTDTRWTELAMYKTLTGKYVIEKVGRSDVFHDNSCKRSSKGKQYRDLDEALEEKDSRDDDTLEDIFAQCPDCKPSYDASPVWAERDISTVSTFATAKDAIRSLYRGDRKDTAGASTLSRVARALLENASAKDEEIRTVFEQPVDIT
jgi:hypothetical protein